MKLTIERSDALRVLSLVAGIAARKSTIPILANVLLETDDAGLRVVASDMSIEISTRLPATVHEGGATTVSADRLLEIVKALPEGADMSLNTSDDDVRMVVKSGRSRFLLPQLEPDAFPRLPDALGDGFTTTAGDMVALFDDAGFMGDASDNRAYVQSVYLTVKGDVLRCYGASGRGMGYRDIDAPDDAIGFVGEMIHLDHVGKLRSLLTAAKGDEVVVAKSVEGQMTLNIADSVVKVVCVNGAPADFDMIMSKASPTNVMTADVDLLIGALRRALVMQTEKVKAVRMVCVEGEMTLTARNMQTGEGSDVISVDTEKDFELTVNGVLLLGILDHIRTERVKISIDPNCLLITDTADARAFYMLMTMKL